MKNKMDDTSKLKIMLFFNSLKKDMENCDDMDFPREGQRYAENGYFSAVEKMNFHIQKFIDNEIENTEDGENE